MYFIALIMLNFVQNVFDFPLIRSLLSRSDFRYKLYPLPGRTSTFCFLVSFLVIANIFPIYSQR